MSGEGLAPGSTSCGRASSAVAGGADPIGDCLHTSFGHTSPLEPQLRGAVTRRAVAKRRSRAPAPPSHRRHLPDVFTSPIVDRVHDELAAV